MSRLNEAKEICKILLSEIVSNWDGKKCILELKKAKYQWRQMEWIGWYFEYKAYQVLSSKLGGETGPKYGRTQFDYLRNGFVWDFKAHIESSSSHPWAIMNDCEAVDSCIDEYGDIGNFDVQLRDGHHRVMGAIAAGEQHVCVNLAKEQLGQFDQYINRVR